MKAMVIERTGPPEVFVEGSVPTPEPGPTQVRVRVRAAAVNPTDVKRRGGKGTSPVALPAVLGWDLAGEVEAVGRQVTRWKRGDRVMACSGPPISSGTYAEYALVEEVQAAAVPDGLSLEEAASLPLVGITAWEALFEKIDLQPGESALVHAGAGGVGSMAVQLAVWRGAQVVTTVGSAEKAEFARRLGASETILYREQDFVARARDRGGFPVIVDPVGGDTFARSVLALAPYGRLAALLGGSGAQLDWAILSQNNLSLHFVMMLKPVQARLLNHLARQGRILEQLSALVTQGLLKPVVFEVVPMREVGRAHALVESRRTMGKVVLAGF